MSWGRGKPKSAGGPEPSAYQRALGLLVRREHSRKELGRKLVAKGVDREDLDLALDKLRRQDFQNDARFAAALARSRSSSGYGPARIRAELVQHGLAREDVAAALEPAKCDWHAAARELVARRYAGKNLARPGPAAQGRGFPAAARLRAEVGLRGGERPPGDVEDCE
jgi:regulatory protein